jgi:hypothetical protein
MTFAIILAVIGIALQVLDARTTLKGFAKGAVEIGGPDKWLMEKLGQKTGLYVAKALACLVIVGLTYLAANGESLAYLVLIGVVAYYGLFVVKANKEWLQAFRRKA